MVYELGTTLVLLPTQNIEEQIISSCNVQHRSIMEVQKFIWRQDRLVMRGLSLQMETLTWTLELKGSPPCHLLGLHDKDLMGLSTTWNFLCHYSLIVKLNEIDMKRFQWTWICFSCLESLHLGTIHVTHILVILYCIISYDKAVTHCFLTTWEKYQEIMVILLLYLCH